MKKLGFYKTQGLYMVSGVFDTFFTEWTFQALYQAREEDSVLQHIFASWINFGQVFFKPEVSRHFKNSIFIAWPLDHY